MRKIRVFSETTLNVLHTVSWSSAFRNKSLISASRFSWVVDIIELRELARADPSDSVLHFTNFESFKMIAFTLEKIPLTSANNVVFPLCEDLPPSLSVCELYAQIPMGEIDIGSRWHTKDKPKGGNGFKRTSPAYAFPNRSLGNANFHFFHQDDAIATECLSSQRMQSVI